MANPTGGAGGGGPTMDPRTARELAAAMGAAQQAARGINESFQRQLEIVTQLRDAMAAITTNMQQMSDVGSQAPMSPGKIQDLDKELQRATKSTQGLTGAISDSSKKLKLDWAKAAAVGISALDGLVQGFKNTMAIMKGASGLFMSVVDGIFSIGQAIIAIPFKMLGGLIGMAKKAQGAMNELAQAVEEVRKQFGAFRGETAGPASKAVMYISQNMNRLNKAGVSVYQVFGNMAQRTKEVEKSIAAMGSTFYTFDESILKNGADIMMFQKGLGLADEDLAAINRNAMRMGKEPTQVMTDMTKYARDLGKEFNIDAKVISRDMGKAMRDLAHFGNLSTKEMALAATYANKLGVSVEKLTGIMDATATFEGAAEGAAKLNQQFGTNINATKIMMEQDPSKKVEMLRQEFLKAGVTADKLLYQEKSLIKSSMGLDDEMLNAALSTKNAGVSLDKMGKVADKTEKKAETQAHAIKSLTEAIDRLVQQGPGAGGFFDHIMQGFTRGIQTTPEFLGLMKNINASLRDAFYFGMRLGKMFVDLFPGVSDMIDGLSKLFSPATFQKMFDGVIKAFDVFKTGGIEKFDDFMEQLKKVFFDFFNKEETGGKKFLDGLKKFGEVVIKVFSVAITWMADKAAEGIRMIIDYIRNPASVAGSIDASGFTSMFQPLIIAIATSFQKLAPLVTDLFELIGQKIYEFVTSEKFLGYLKKAAPVIAAVLFGPMLIRASVGALSATLIDSFSASVRNAFTGSAGKKLSDMTGKELSALLQRAPVTPPPVPAPTPTVGLPQSTPSMTAPVGSQALGPALAGTPPPEVVGPAQKTAGIINGPLIAKLLLALAGVIAIGLVAFWAAAKMAEGMSIETITKAMLILGGTAIAILPAAGALFLLSKVPSAQLLGALPALVAIGVLLPFMALLGVGLAKLTADVDLSSIIKAGVLIFTMSLALVPAALALTLLIGPSGPLVAGGPAIWNAIRVLTLLVPGMGALGLVLANAASGTDLSSIIKAGILITTMSIGLAVAAYALATLITPSNTLVAGALEILAALGALAVIVPFMALLGVGLAKLTSSTSIGDIVKAGVLIVTMSGALLVSAFALTLLAAQSAALIAGALPILGALALLAVIVPAMAWMGVKLAEFIKDSKVGIGDILSAALLITTMSVALVAAAFAMSLLIPSGAAVIPGFPIIMGTLGALTIIIGALAGIGYVLVSATSKFKPGQIGAAMLVVVSMVTSLTAVAASLIVLGVLGVAVAMTTIGVLMGVGAFALMIPAFTAVAGMVAEIPNKVKKEQVIVGSEILQKSTTAMAEAMKSLLVMSDAVQQMGSIFGVFLSAGNVEEGSKAISKVITSMGKMLEDVAKPAASIATSVSKMPSGSDMESKVKLFGEIMKAIGELANVISSSVKNLNFSMFSTADDKVKMMDSMAGLVDKLTAGMNKVMSTVFEAVNKFGASGKSAESAKALAEMLSAVAKISQALTPPPGMMNADTTAAESAMLLDKINANMTLAGTKITDILKSVQENLMPALTQLGPNVDKNKIQAVATVIDSIGKMTAALTPSKEVIDLVKESWSKDTIFEGLSKYMESVGKTIGSVVESVTKWLPDMISRISEIKIGPEGFKLLNVMGPLIGSIASMVSALIEPVQTFVKEMAGGAFADEAAFTGALTKLGQVMGKINENLAVLLGDQGSVVKVIRTLGGSNMGDVEQAKKLAPLVGSIANLAIALVPKPEIINAMKEADKEKDKVGNVVSSTERIITAVQTSLGSVLGSVAGLIQNISGKAITTEQVQMLDKLAPLLTAVIKMTSDIVSSIVGKDAKQLSAEDITNAQTFLGSVAAAMGKMFEQMSGQLDSVFKRVQDVINFVKKSKITPEELKNGIDVIKSMFEMINTMTSVISNIRDQMKPAENAPAPQPWAESIASLGLLVEAIFKDKNDGYFKQILTILSDPLIGKLGKNKDAIAALSSAFDFVAKIPGIIEGFKKASAGSEGVSGEAANINSDAIAKDVQSVVSVISKAFDDATVKNLNTAMGRLAAFTTGYGDIISKVKDAFTGIGQLATTIVSVAESESLKSFAGVTDVVAAERQPIVGIKGLTEMLKGVDSAIGAMPSVLSGIQQKVGKGGLAAFDKTFGDLEGYLTKVKSSLSVINNMGAAEIQQNLEAITAIVTSIKTIDDTLNQLPKMTLDAKMTQVQNKLGYAKKGVYKVDGKEVVVQIELNVTMDADGVEKALISRANSVIRDRINSLVNSAMYTDQSSYYINRTKPNVLNNGRGQIIQGTYDE